MKKTAADWLKIGAVGVAGLIAGGVLAGTLSANAENTATGTPEANRDLSQPQRSDEEQFGPGEPDGLGEPGGPHGHGRPGGPPSAGWDDEHEGGDDRT